MKKFLVITGLALSLVSANAFANGTTTIVRGATKVRTGGGAPKVQAPKVKAPVTTVKAPKGSSTVAPVVNSSGSNASGSVQNATGPKLQIGSGSAAPAKAAPAIAKGNAQAAKSEVAGGEVCIGGPEIVSKCGAFTDKADQTLVRSIIDNERTPAEVAQSLATAQGISVAEATAKVDKLFAAGCLEMVK